MQPTTCVKSRYAGDPIRGSPHYTRGPVSPQECGEDSRVALGVRGIVVLAAREGWGLAVLEPVEAQKEGSLLFVFV